MTLRQPPRLFSYTMRVDDGAAPNPFYGMCTLAICKPGIRRVASNGDWIAGLGSMHAPSGDLSGRLIFAMKVERVLSWPDYDRLALENWPHRIPNFSSVDRRDRLGHCIYDFSSPRPRQRLGVHGPGNVATDLGGQNVLLSTDFYYFGRNAKPLPNDLLAICHQTQGHRSNSNHLYFGRFVEWLRRIEPVADQLYGPPDLAIDWESACSRQGCEIREHDDADDQER